MNDRIDYEDGCLDDVVVHDVDLFRLEYMRKGLIWIRCYRTGKPDIIIWLDARGAIIGRHEVEDRTKTSGETV